jgi:hypothetical protein
MLPVTFKEIFFFQFFLCLNIWTLVYSGLFVILMSYVDLFLAYLVIMDEYV